MATAVRAEAARTEAAREALARTEAVRAEVARAELRCAGGALSWVRTAKVKKPAFRPAVPPPG